MLFSVLDQLQDSPWRAFISLLALAGALAVAITVHEFSHALSAWRLGDFTARSQGRLTLHPKAHLDPVGSAMILVAGFGWGKPTPVNPAYLRPGPRPGMAVVALAGPVSNVIVALAASIPIRAGLIGSENAALTLFRGDPSDIVAYLFGSLVFWNLLLAAFNLLPIAPLDGFKVALGVLPSELAHSFARLERYGPAILIGLIAIDLLIPGPSVLSSIIRPILNLLSLVVLGRQVL